MAFGDEFSFKDTSGDWHGGMRGNAVVWNTAARQLLALKGVLDFQAAKQVEILTTDAEAAIRLAFARDPETVGYLGNYPFGNPGHDEVSDRRTTATTGLLNGILDQIRASTTQPQQLDVPQA